MTEVHVRGAHALVRTGGFEDEVAVEEPLEIRVDGRPLAVTMRTPGEDEELALGFLFGEGLIDGTRAAGPPGDLAANTVEVGGPLLREPAARSFYTTSSCGVWGKGALEAQQIARAPDQPFGEEKAAHQLLVVAGRAHGHGQRAPVDPDLERLLDRDLVLEAVRAHERVRPADVDLRHALDVDG